MYDTSMPVYMTCMFAATHAHVCPHVHSHAGYTCGLWPCMVAWVGNIIFMDGLVYSSFVQLNCLCWWECVLEFCFSGPLL